MASDSFSEDDDVDLFSKKSKVPRKPRLHTKHEYETTAALISKSEGIMTKMASCASTVASHPCSKSVTLRMKGDLQSAVVDAKTSSEALMGRLKILDATNQRLHEEKGHLLQRVNGPSPAHHERLLTEKDMEIARLKKHINQQVSNITSLQKSGDASKKRVTELVAQSRNDAREIQKLQDQPSQHKAEMIKLQTALARKEDILSATLKLNEETLAAIQTSNDARIKTLMQNVRQKDQEVIELRGTVEEEDDELRVLWRKVLRYEAEAEKDGGRKRARTA